MTHRATIAVVQQQKIYYDCRPFYDCRKCAKEKAEKENHVTNKG